MGSRDDPSYLPAGVCVVLPGQPAKAKLSSQQTAAMIKYAVRERTPAANAKSIVTEGLRVLGINPPDNKVLVSAIANDGKGSADLFQGHFDVNFAAKAKLLAIPGRVLQSPQNIIYSNGKVNPRFGSWNLQKDAREGGAQFKFTPKRQNATWAVLWITQEGKFRAWNHQPAAFRATMNAFGAKLTEVGLTLGAPLKVDNVHLQGTTAPDLDLVDEKIRTFAPRPTLLFVVVPAKEDSVYNRVKFCCDVKYGIINVCALGTKMQEDRGQQQYFANVALKFNLKLGGNNHTLDPAKLGIIAQGKTMLVGLDVTHPSPGSAKTAPSVAGIVASIDRNLSQFPAAMSVQGGGDEMVAKLSEMFRSRLQLWKRHNNVLPENVIIYRDGVSEGQFNLVVDQELPLIRSACVDVYRNLTPPRLAIVICGKRHHTRFYPTRLEDASPSGNPQNGTVVDRDVTECRMWDFFLQAHTPLGGTARPAHYTVVHDEVFAHYPVPAGVGNAADALEDLTHNLCYLYGRATKAVSICPPAYYADLVCERARKYLAHAFDPSLEATPDQSVRSGDAGGGGAPPVKPDDFAKDIKLHDAVKDVMFYI